MISALQDISFFNVVVLILLVVVLILVLLEVELVVELCNNRLLHMILKLKISFLFISHIYFNIQKALLVAHG